MSLDNPVLARLAAELPLERKSWQAFAADGEWPRAAVLVALTPHKAPEVLLGRRAMHLALHPGEIAFAGGKREDIDVTPWDTALREAQEEVGISDDQVIPLGELPPLITRTGFRVFPCVAAIPEAPELVVDPGEFDSVFYTPLATFADKELFRLETMSDGERMRRVPHYQVEDDNIWGVTAAILAQLANVAYDAGLDLERDWRQEP